MSAPTLSTSMGYFGKRSRPGQGRRQAPPPPAGGGDGAGGDYGDDGGDVPPDDEADMESHVHVSYRPEPRRYRGGSPPEPKRFSGCAKDASAFARWIRAMDSDKILAAPYLPPKRGGPQGVGPPRRRVHGRDRAHSRGARHRLLRPPRWHPDDAPAFGERPLRKNTPVISAFEKIRRFDRESLSKFVGRFKRMARSMLAQGVARFDDEIRARKLLETSCVQPGEDYLARNGRTHVQLRPHRRRDQALVPRTALWTSSAPKKPPWTSGAGKGHRKGYEKAYVAAADPEADDSGSTSREASEADPEEASLEQDDEPSGDSSSPGALMAELAQTLTVTAKKLKAVMLGRGRAKRAKPPSSSAPRSSSSFGQRSARSSSRPNKTAGDKSMDMTLLKQKHPCSVCGELGHWYNDKR